MENHYFETMFNDPNLIGHCIVLSLSDLSTWCYACQSYIKHNRLQQISKVAEIGTHLIAYLSTHSLHSFNSLTLRQRNSKMMT